MPSSEQRTSSSRGDVAARSQGQFKASTITSPSSISSTVRSLQEHAADVFQSLDEQNRNALDFPTTMAGLGQLGVPDGQDTLATIGGALGMEDHSLAQGHQFTLPEFLSCYERLIRPQLKPTRLDEAVSFSRASQGVEEAEQERLVKTVYTNYCRYTVGQGRLMFDPQDPRMSSTQFVKLCWDMGFIQPNGPLSVVTIDLIFHKCKPQGKRRFQFPDFLKALGAVAAESKLPVLDFLCIIGSQIKPSTHFYAPKPVVIQPQAQNLKRAANPREAWPRPTSEGSTQTQSSSIQDLKRAIEEAEIKASNGSSRMASPLEAAVKQQGLSLSNKAQGMEGLIMGLHEQFDELRAQNAKMASELKALQQQKSETLPIADSTAKELQSLQAALTVALKAVGVESIEVAEEPSMLTVAAAYHHRFLFNDTTLAQLSDKVARLEAQLGQSQQVDGRHLASFEKQLREQQAAQERSRLQQEESAQRLQAVQQELERSRQQQEGSAQQLEAVQQEQERSRQQQDGSAQKLEVAQQQLEAVQKELERSRQQQAGSTKQLEAAQQQLEAVQHELERSRQQQEGSAKQLEAVQQQLAQQEKDGQMAAAASMLAQQQEGTAGAQEVAQKLAELQRQLAEQHSSSQAQQQGAAQQLAVLQARLDEHESSQQQESSRQLQECSQQIAELEQRLGKQESRLQQDKAKAEKGVRAAQKPGMEAAAAVLEVLGRGPCDAQHRMGLMASAQALRALSEGPASAASKQEHAAAARALTDAGIDPSDQQHRPGMEAAAAAIEGVTKNTHTGAHASDLDAAREALKSVCRVPWDDAHKSGVLAGVRGLQAMVDDPSNSENAPGIAAAVSLLSALGCDPADPVQKDGLDAARAALATVCGMPDGSGTYGPGITAAATSMTALSPEAAPQGAPVAAAVAALEKEGVVAHDNVHQPGMLAAATMLKDLSEGSEKGAGKRSLERDARRAYSALQLESSSAQMPALQQQLGNLEQQLQQTSGALDTALKSMGPYAKESGAADAAHVPLVSEQLEAQLSELELQLDHLRSETEMLKVSCAHKPELKELENHLLDRLSAENSGNEQVRQTVDIIVADLTKLGSEHGVGMGSGDRSAWRSNGSMSILQPFTLSTIMRNFMTYKEIAERFATLKALQDLSIIVKNNSELARQNGETILQAMKAVDQKFTAHSDSMAKVLIRTARQVDYLHNVIKDIPGAGEPMPPSAFKDSPSGSTHPDAKNRGLRAMGTIARSSGMKALLEHQDQDGENAVDRALRSLNDRVAENAAAELEALQGAKDTDAKIASLQPEARMPFSSSSAAWAMAARSMKAQQSPGEPPRRNSPGWDLLLLAARDQQEQAEKAEQAAAEKEHEAKPDAPEGRNKVYAPPRQNKSRSNINSPPGQQTAPGSPARQRDPSTRRLRPSETARKAGMPGKYMDEDGDANGHTHEQLRPIGSIFSRRGVDSDTRIPPAAAGRWANDEVHGGALHPSRLSQGYLPPGAVAPAPRPHVPPGATVR